MTVASVTDLKARLSEYLRMVKRGGEVQIFERGRLVARLVSPSASEPHDDTSRRLERLARDGVMRLGGGGATGLLDRPPIEVPGGLSGALEADRADRV